MLAPADEIRQPAARESARREVCLNLLSDVKEEVIMTSRPVWNPPRAHRSQLRPHRHPGFVGVATTAKWATTTTEGRVTTSESLTLTSAKNNPVPGCRARTGHRTDNSSVLAQRTGEAGLLRVNTAAGTRDVYPATYENVSGGGGDDGQWRYTPIRRRSASKPLSGSAGPILRVELGVLYSRNDRD